MVPMTETRPDKANPFQWYLGKAFSLQGRSYVVEDCEVRGRDLSILLRDPSDGATRHVSPLELIAGAGPV